MSGQEWVPEPADLRGDDRPLSPAVGPEPGAGPPPFSPPTGPAYPPPHVVISPRHPEGEYGGEAEYEDDDAEAGTDTDPADDGDGDEPAAAPRRRFGFGFRLPRFRARRDDGTETEEGEVEVIAGPDGEPLPPDDDDATAAEEGDEAAAPRRRFSFPFRLPRFGRASADAEVEADAEPDADGELDPNDLPDPAEVEDAAVPAARSRRTGLLTALSLSREARVGLVAVISFLVLVALFVNNKGRLVRMTMPNGGENQAAVDPARPDDKLKDGEKPDGKAGEKPKSPPAGTEVANKAGKPEARPNPTTPKSDDPSARFAAGAGGLAANSAPVPAPGGGLSPLEPNSADATLPTAAPVSVSPLETAPTAPAVAEVPAAAPTLPAGGLAPLDPAGTANPATAPTANAELPAMGQLPPMPEGPAEPPATGLPAMPDPTLTQEPKATEPPGEAKTPETAPDLMPALPSTTVTPPAEPAQPTPPAANPMPMPTPAADPTEPTLPPIGAESAHPADSMAMPMPTPQPAATPSHTPEPAAVTPPSVQTTPPFEPVPSGAEAATPAAVTPPTAPAGPDAEGWTTIPMMGSRRSTIVSTPGGVDVAAGVVAGAAAAAAAEVIPDGPPPREDAAARNQAEIKLHRVAPGENFWTISRRYYGEGRFYKALWAANSKEVPDIRELYVGDVVRIPPPEMLDPARIDPPTASRPRTADRNRSSDVSRTSNPGDDPRAEQSVATLPPVRRKPAGEVEPNPNEPPRRPTYTVRANQTLRSIARDTLGDSRRADEILQLNRPLLRDAGDLAPGQRITLPADATVNGRRGR